MTKINADQLPAEKTGGRSGESARSVWAAPLPVTGIALSAGLAALIIAGLLTGMGRAGTISDPGALTRWGLPAATYIHHTAMATAVGAALMAAVAVPFRSGPRNRQNAESGQEHPLYTRTLQIAMVAAVVWTMAAIAVLVLTFSSLAGLPLSADQGFSEGFFDYALNIATGQAWLAVTLIAGASATLLAVVRAPAGIGFIGILGLCAIVPMAMVGHSSSGDDHTAAVNSLGLHLLGVVVWVGGLIVLALLSPEIARTARMLRKTRNQSGDALLGTLLGRYSILAGLSLVTVAASGVINAELRVTGFADLFGTDYGLMLVVKASATLLLAGIGFAHRTWLIPALFPPAGKPRSFPDVARTDADTSARVPDVAAPLGRLVPAFRPKAPSRVLWQLILVEVAIMTAVFGISAVLGRTPPPVPDELPPDATPARLLTGYDLPPEQMLAHFFTQWRFDWLWVAVILFLAIWYLRSLVKVRRRGIAWPIMRAVSWLFGLGVLFWITSGGPAVYGMVTFSGHMVQHMTLTMVAPIFLVMGSPVTLAMRALPVRGDGTRGAREWILWLVHSTWSKIVTHPIVAAANFAGSILLFYYTPLFGLSLEYHLGHIFMTVHFLLTGYIFALVLIGRDPLPSRPPHFLRVIILLATMVFHAFFAIALMSAEQLIQPDWFGNMGHGWFAAIDDQHNGGELMWGLGEIPAVLLGVIVCVQWAKDDTREMKRLDREAERTGDAELEAYNEMLEQISERGYRSQEFTQGASRPGTDLR